MRQIAVGSTNRVKKNAVKLVFPDDAVKTIDSNSNVLSQPFGNEMTREGAINRATNALERLNVDYGIGLEGGVVFIRDQLYVCNWGALLTNSGELFTASGASIPLPESFTQHLLRGEQLVNLVRNYMNGENARAHEGAVGLFTNQLVIREQIYKELVLLLKGQLMYANK